MKRGDKIKPTIGKNVSRSRVILYVSCTVGVNPSILGYMSNGEMVPEVMMTLENRSNTGRIARAGSRHLVEVNLAWLSNLMESIKQGTYVKWNTGLGIVEFSVSNGSKINRKPMQREYLSQPIAWHWRRMYAPFS